MLMLQLTDSELFTARVPFGRLPRRAQSMVSARRGLRRSILVVALMVAVTCAAPQRCLAAEGDAPQGAAVTVVKAAKACFSDVVDVFGILVPKQEVAVRPPRPGLKVAEVLADPGQTVKDGQPLARLSLPEGGAITIEAPAAGLIASSSAVVGAIASPRGEPLFSIFSGGEFDLVGQVPTRDISKLKVDQPATVKIIGAGDVEGKVRRIAATVEPNSQLGQVFVAIDTKEHLLANASGRASIKTGESCAVAVPLTAILYSTAGTVVQVIRHERVETRRVETGLMSAARVEIREGLADGDVVVARAGALLREGDQVRPVFADAAPK